MFVIPLGLAASRLVGRSFGQEEYTVFIGWQSAISSHAGRLSWLTAGPSEGMPWKKLLIRPGSRNGPADRFDSVLFDGWAIRNPTPLREIMYVRMYIMGEYIYTVHTFKHTYIHTYLVDYKS